MKVPHARQRKACIDPRPDSLRLRGGSVTMAGPEGRAAVLAAWEAQMVLRKRGAGGGASEGKAGEIVRGSGMGGGGTDGKDGDRQKHPLTMWEVPAGQNYTWWDKFADLVARPGVIPPDAERM